MSVVFLRNVNLFFGYQNFYTFTTVLCHNGLKVNQTTYETIMKKLPLLLLVVVLSLVACTQSSKELSGFGGFDIDSKLADLDQAAQFRNTMPDEYYCHALKLSDAIGEVSAMNVTTEHGKIIDVKFSSTEKTNLDAIQKALAALEKNGKVLKFDNALASFATYSNKDETIFFVDIAYKGENLKNGKPKHEFSYSNKKAIANDEQLIRAMASSK